MQITLRDEKLSWALQKSKRALIMLACNYYSTLNTNHFCRGLPTRREPRCHCHCHSRSRSRSRRLLLFFMNKSSKSFCLGIFYSFCHFLDTCVNLFPCKKERKRLKPIYEADMSSRRIDGCIQSVSQLVSQSAFWLLIGMKLENKKKKRSISNQSLICKWLIEIYDYQSLSRVRVILLLLLGLRGKAKAMSDIDGSFYWIDCWWTERTKLSSWSPKC